MCSTQWYIWKFSTFWGDGDENFTWPAASLFREFVQSKAGVASMFQIAVSDKRRYSKGKEIVLECRNKIQLFPLLRSENIQIYKSCLPCISNRHLFS